MARSRTWAIGIGDLEMALSDACFNFLNEVAQAADRLAHTAHHYSAPDYLIQYGPEIDALKRMAVQFRDHPYDTEAGSQLLDLASSVGRYLDTPPDAKELPERSTKVAQLLQEMSSDLGMEDNKALRSVVENVVVNTPYTEKAAERLKGMLKKVGGSTYEIAVKLLSDIATAAAKTMLGL
jgi:uncharacterized protein DUF2321